MKIFRLVLLCLFSFCCCSGLFAQNLFLEKIDLCDATGYCADCGTVKANCNPFTLDYISDKINRKYNFNGASGTISFQVLVDSTGFSCVLSHTDATHSSLTSELIRYLNGNIWKPALEHGKPVSASVVVTFKINYGKISGAMQRMDLSEMAPPGKPTVANTQFQYSNPSLKNYDLTVFTKYNSPLPDNVGQECVVDNSDILWYATAKGLTRFDGTRFNPVNEFNSPFTATTDARALAVDKENAKWMIAKNAIYKYSVMGWQQFDSTHFVTSGAYKIVPSATGDMFFPNKKGLLILRSDKIRLMDKNFMLDLPSNNVYFAYYDSQERLWIGTFGGSIMIDKQKNITAFNLTDSPLKNTCISNIVEGENGDLYFSVNALDKTEADNEEEGIIIRKADGAWLHYNDKNSGMPANHVNTLLYDKAAHVLWAGTQLAGLARYDLKDGWENYNNANSAMPGFQVNQIAEDSKGTVYVATVNGMVMIRKKD